VSLLSQSHDTKQPFIEGNFKDPMFSSFNRKLRNKSTEFDLLNVKNLTVKSYILETIAKLLTEVSVLRKIWAILYSHECFL
jgi:hypothetical protein